MKTSGTLGPAESAAPHSALQANSVQCWVVSGRPAMQAWAAWMRMQQGLPLTDWPEELPFPIQSLAEPLPSQREKLRRWVKRHLKR